MSHWGWRNNCVASRPCHSRRVVVRLLATTFHLDKADTVRYYHHRLSKSWQWVHVAISIGGPCQPTHFAIAAGIISIVGGRISRYPQKCVWWWTEHPQKSNSRYLEWSYSILHSVYWCYRAVLWQQQGLASLVQLLILITPNEIGSWHGRARQWL